MPHSCPVPLSNRSTRLLGWLLLAYWVSILVATHIPSTVVPNLHVTDKVEHFTAYGLLAMLLCGYAWAKRWCIWRSTIYPVVIGAVYGAVDELTQPWFSRACDIRDWRADVIGTLLGVAIFTTVRVFLSRRQSPA